MPSGIYQHKKGQGGRKGRSGVWQKTPIARLLNSQRMKGNKNPLGFKHSLETRIKMSNSTKGEKAPNWKGGITLKNKADRQTFEYKEWRKAVFERDNYTCLWCGKRGVELNADHIRPFAYFPEFRFDINNGRTLCVECHKKTDTYKKKYYK